MPEMSWQELRDDTDDVLGRVEAGESFTITRDGVPVAVLVPYAPAEISMPVIDSSPRV